jgi:hypothetical protein
MAATIDIAVSFMHGKETRKASREAIVEAAHAHVAQGARGRALHDLPHGRP